MTIKNINDEIRKVKEICQIEENRHIKEKDCKSIYCQLHLEEAKLRTLKEVRDLIDKKCEECIENECDAVICIKEILGEAE